MSRNFIPCICATIVGGQGREFEMGVGGRKSRCQTIHTCHSSTPDLSDTHPQSLTINLLAWHSCLKAKAAEAGRGSVNFFFLPKACQSVSCLFTPLESCAGVLRMPS